MRCLAAALLTLAVLASAIVAAADKSSEWEPTVQAAKKEGQVTVYVHSTYAPALESGAFQKAFPDIKLLTVSGVELDLERRFMAERRAGKYLADVFMVGVLRSYNFYQAKLLDPIKPALLLPEVLDESKWWGKAHRYADPEKRYLFRYVGSSQLGQVYYNTQLVNAKEFSSFRDFLNPKWKARMEMRDIRAPGTGCSAIHPAFPFRIQKVPERGKFLRVDQLRVVVDLPELGRADVAKKIALLRIGIAMRLAPPFRLVQDFRQQQRRFDRVEQLRLIEIVAPEHADHEDVGEIFSRPPLSHEAALEVELDAAYGKEFDVRKRFLKRAGLERRRVRAVNVDRHLPFFFRRLDGPLPFRGFIRGGNDARREQRDRKSVV